MQINIDVNEKTQILLNAIESLGLNIEDAIVDYDVISDEFFWKHSDYMFYIVVRAAVGDNVPYVGITGPYGEDYVKCLSPSDTIATIEAWVDRSIPTLSNLFAEADSILAKDIYK